MRKLWVKGFLTTSIIFIFWVFVVHPFLVPAVLCYDVVIYGGGFAGCASAYSAAWAAPEKKVLLIVPEPVAQLGGLGTVGGQNFADIRYWQNQLVTAGSFQRWFEKSGQFYNTEQMAEIITKDLARFANVTILYQHDLRKVKTEKIAKGQRVIKSIVLAPVYRDEQGAILWGKGRSKVEGEVFIDASAEGRLARLASIPLVVGRQDWPREYLPLEEQEEEWARQQAATLMFKVKGVKTPTQPDLKGDLHFVTDTQGSWAIVGGKETWQSNAVVRRFNERYGSQGFAIKPLNAAQNGAGSEEWWVNMLLVFDVDGRAREKDRGTALFPVQGVGQKTVDQAWRETREVLQKPEFLEVLQQFRVVENGEMYGFGEASLVWDQNKQPIVGEIMYLRETVHTLQGARNGEESDGYALTTQEIQKAGSNSQDGKDQDNYVERIGLGYYMMDINAFMYEDLLEGNRYVWPVTSYLRPDWQRAGGQPAHPVYLPYAMLKSTGCVNLLLPGYAAGCSSLAWAEVRVLPNLAVLGDAAGVAAARAVLFREKPADFRAEQIKWVQEKLDTMGARLEK
ncbi:MAG: FAD-dependent oxidoreductase [Clostridia bacterium]|nr:FAD-dependent oxidoreductase [Clostridia bacterium]